MQKSRNKIIINYLYNYIYIHIYIYLFQSKLHDAILSAKHLKKYHRNPNFRRGYSCFMYQQKMKFYDTHSLKTGQ